MRVRDHDPEPDPKVRMKSVPKYPTLLAALGLDDDQAAAEPVIDDEVHDLMTAMLTNTGGWEGFGRGL